MERQVGFLRELFELAIQSVQPRHCLPSYLPPLSGGRTVVIGAGKASAAMARVVEEQWGEVLEGLVITRYGHAVSCESIEIVEAGHPVPDESGVEASRRMRAMVAPLSRADRVICLLSGGGSALLTLPAEGITLRDKQLTTQQLLRCGASIDEINCVRKHLSAIKGGRLAQVSYPADVITLAISDVPYDEPAVIASGPTVPDPSTVADAEAVLKKYLLSLPRAVVNHIEYGADETPKPGDPGFDESDYRLVATPQQMLETAAEHVRREGLNPLILGDSLEGESRESAIIHAGIARQIQRHGQPTAPPAVLLSGGETSVTINGPGKGGPNTEFMLALLHELKGCQGIYAIACDTDGIDGSEDNAGAWISPYCHERALKQGLAPEEFLNKNDSHGFFRKLDALVATGPTFTNVNDFRAILVEPET